MTAALPVIWPDWQVWALIAALVVMVVVIAVDEIRHGGDDR